MADQVGLEVSIFDRFSGLELLWVSLSGAYLVKGLYQGMVDDGKSCGKDFCGQTGIFRFTKRPIKRWLLGLGFNGLLVFSTYRAYCSGVASFGWISNLLDKVSMQSAVDSDRLSTLIGSSFLFVHLSQKLHQSVFVNVYGHPTQGLLDFVTPYIYVSTVGLTLLSQAPPLEAITDSWFDWSLFNWRHLAGCILFLVGTYQDHACQPALSQTRRNRAGHIVTNEHKVPKGGLYELIACPNFLMVVVSHLGIGVTLGFNHRAWWLCTWYVWVSHMVRARGRQRWYLLKFEDYPANRKSMIPYLL